MKFIVKEHESKEGYLVAIIDLDLAGQEIVEGNKILDLKSNFYKGEEKTEEEVLEIINKATHINAVGNKIIQLLTDKRIIESAMSIGGVAYAQGIVVKE